MLTDAHHIAIRVGLVNTIRNTWPHRRFDTSRDIVKNAVSTLRLVRNSWKLESTPWKFPVK